MIEMELEEMLNSFAMVATIELGKGNVISEEFFDEALKVTANASLLKVSLSEELIDVSMDFRISSYDEDFEK